MSHFAKRLVLAVRSGVVLFLAIWLTTQPGIAFGPASDGATPAAGSLSVTTDPVGATVFVDGHDVGATPMRSVAVPAGEHRVRIVKAGYLENARVITVPAGQPATVKVSLTRSSGTSEPAMEQVTSGGGGGGSKKWLWIGVAGAGAVTAAVLLAKKNHPPSGGAITVSPTGTGMANVTSFSFTSSASDPDNDPLTYTWDFGDGASGSGATATHTYTSTGTKTVSLSVSDGKASATATPASVVVGPNMTGTWIGGVEPQFGCTITFNLTQNNTALTGTMPLIGNCTGAITLAASSVGGTTHPTSVSITSAVYTFTVGTTAFANQTSKFTGNTSADGTTMTGTYNLSQSSSGFSQNTTMTFRKQ